MMQPAVNAIHQAIIDAFNEFGGYDSSIMYISTPKRKYKVKGMKNAARILESNSEWSISTKHLGLVLAT